MQIEFPTTLRQINDHIAALAKRGGAISVGGSWHVYGEYMGRRYYIASFFYIGNAEHHAAEMKRRLPRADFYYRGRADSTWIDADEEAMILAYDE
jgi:hypothetical protein